MSMKRILLACGLAGAIAGPGPAAADGPGEVRVDAEALRQLPGPARHVSVVGTARVSVVPDVAEVSLGVTTTRPTALAAVEANNEAMAKLADALKGRGLAAKDIQTAQVSIAPQYSRQPVPHSPALATHPRPPVPPGIPEEATAPKVVGYEVSNTVRVRSRDRSKVGELIDAAVRAGSNQIYGISFSIEDREAVLEGLRARAFGSAKRKAALYAERAGLVLGPALSIVEGEAGWPSPQPPMAFDMAPRAMPAPSAPSMLVSEGEQEVSLSVSVTFELGLPK